MTMIDRSYAAEDGDYESTGTLLDYDEWTLPAATCPLDGGDGVPLGTLGRLTWYRCRSCGINFNTHD